MAISSRRLVAGRKTLRCHALPLATCQECHIIRDGKTVLGPVAVWRSPTLRMNNVQLWVAKALPDFAKYVPDNGLVCSRQSGGALDLEDGDYDGDQPTYTQDLDVMDVVRPALLHTLHVVLGGGGFVFMLAK